MRVIDSHTADEPTRLIIDGGPQLGHGSMAERRAIFARDFDSIRGFTLNEPRGFDAIVGALLCEPVDKTCAAGLIFFNNAGYLGMCGHGTIGATVTLAHLGLIGLGTHRFETPVGIVSADLKSRNEVTVQNVASYRFRKDVQIAVEGFGLVTGDIAWGGNWFFLTSDTPMSLSLTNAASLTAYASAIKTELHRANIMDADGAEIDHIELFGPPVAPGANSRNFVLCPGGAYDRSPCGTGTSAKLACLAASSKLNADDDWVQESIVGSHFTGRYKFSADGAIIPSITGSAFVVSDATLIRDSNDPFADGIGYIAGRLAN